MARSSTALSAKNSAAEKLPLSFFGRSTHQVARELLGKILVSRSRGIRSTGRIVETEAYVGEIDPAAHCYRGKTPRSSIMYGPPGRAYVYFIYGMYEMLNFVTEAEGIPGAVLVRALEPLEGISAMKRRRGVAKADRELCNGPGKLCQAMGIPLAWNHKPLDSPDFHLVDDGFEWEDSGVMKSPRVGITGGTEHFWRYFPAENRFVSRVPENKKARWFRKN